MRRYCLMPVCMLSFLLSLQVAWGQQDFSKIELKTTKVNGNVYMLEGVGGFAGGNVAVSVGDDGILIVDDQLAPMSDKIKKALSELSSGDLKFVLNTHWHGDHSGGNETFGKEATIIAHENVRKRLMAAQKNFFGESPARPKGAWPVLTFGHSVTIHFNGEAVNVLHYPTGHTDGDSMIYFTDSNVLHMGDHFFNGMFPFVDLTTGGNVLGFADNIKKVIDSVPADAKIIPGHGPLATMADLKGFHEMLEETIAHVQERMTAGKSITEIQEEGLPAKWDSFGGGFIKPKTWIMFIYHSVIARGIHMK